MNRAAPLVAAGTAMWNLVERHTGHVGYKGGAKTDKLQAIPPVIDCSGWTALLLATGMQAANAAAGSETFSAGDLAALHTWSDHMIEVLECRSGTILEGDRISFDALPPYATIGLQQGGGAWAANHPRPQGITHVVQIVRHPGNDAPLVSEAQGWAEPRGLRLMPLADWLGLTQPYLKAGKAWAVDAFATLDASNSRTA
ncbi:MAG: hypothetical protein J0H19_13725 [Rhodospirillales bacterium]|nr:hypothetical protein [Rhodospirillales bacterium]MBN8927673.1 hypothetical protein [Rhodospirillales bacterium]